MAEQKQNSFIPRERGSLPRILLLDFDKQVEDYLVKLGYAAFSGHSGFSSEQFQIPKHESEIEIVFWDVSSLCEEHTRAIESDEIEANLLSLYHRIRSKKGFFVIFLGEEPSFISSIISETIPCVVNRRFTFNPRLTSTLDLNAHEEKDVWNMFYKQFVLERNVHFCIDWNDNCVNLNRYFDDEDGNFYAVVYDNFAIVPKIEEARKKDALKFLLQDILPIACKGDEIFPDKYYFQWANKDNYLPRLVGELKKKNRGIIAKAEEEIASNDDAIKREMEESEYLSNLLIADDSDLFPSNKKLSACVQNVLEKDFGFKITDVDAMRIQAGKSLKEDKWIEDEGFFALVEIKGTERGAKASWVRTDLNAHIREFEVLKAISGVDSFLIFNHERRTEPEKRNIPFCGDDELLEYCKKSKIRLIPVYELFKIARDIKRDGLTKEDARKLLKDNLGLFNYKTSSETTGKETEEYENKGNR